MIAIISAIEDDDERLTVERWYRRYYGLMLIKHLHCQMMRI